MYYGIDLGTTYTVVACVDMNNKSTKAGQLPVKLLTIPQHSPMDYDGSDKSEMLASILGVNKEGEMFVGNKLYRLKGHPDFQKDKNLFYHWKLDLGISQKPLYKNAVMSDLDDATKIAGKILNYCRVHILEPDKTWKNVIVTVPASFQANQRNDVMKAIEYARIQKDEQMLIDEPNAAFIGYLNDASDEEKAMLFESGNKKILIIDFGGGTCDLSVLKLQNPENMQLKISNLAISRYNDLGGQDVDTIIAEQFLLPVFQEDYADVVFTAEELELVIIPQLSVIAEKLKIDLSRTIASRYTEYSQIPESSGHISILDNQVIRVKNRDYKIEQVTLGFNQLKKVNNFLFSNDEYKLQVVDKVIQSVPAVISDILKKSNLSLADINSVLFAGGSVQNLMFVQETMRLFPNAQALIPGRPDLLIAKGAAVYSFYRNALGIELLQPICSDTIGVVLHNAPFFPLIEAGVSLPASIELPSFSIQSNRQMEVSIPFCIGSEEKIVCELHIKLPADITTSDIISITADLSTNKLLSVKVTVGNKLLGNVELLNPFVLANVSEEERMLQNNLLELEHSRSIGDRNAEKQILRSLVYEYYDLANYTRATSLAEEWTKKFDTTDSGMNNLLFCAYNNLGNRRKAEHYVDNGLKYSPTNSTLNYNKSLLVEKNEGGKASLEFLKKLPETVQQHTSIRFRIALLEYYAGNRQVAGKIAEEYNKGGFMYVSDFEYELLKRIVELFGFKMRTQIISNNEKDNRKNSFNQNELLRVNAEFPAKKSN